MGIDDLIEHRKSRLAELVKSRFDGNEAALGRALGYTDGSFVRQMLRDGPTARAVSEKTVAKIEQLPGLSGWFSAAVGFGSIPRFTATLPPTLSPYVARGRLQSLPVLSFSDLEFMTLSNDDARLGSAPRIAAGPESGPKVKAVRVADDSMAPTMRPGDLVHLDPDLTPHPGDKVLVQDNVGAYHLREYRLRSGGAFEAAAHNPAHATLHSGADGLRVIAVATHMTHSLRAGALTHLSVAVLGTVGALFVGSALCAGLKADAQQAIVASPPSAHASVHIPEPSLTIPGALA